MGTLGVASAAELRLLVWMLNQWATAIPTDSVILIINILIFNISIIMS